MSFQSMPARKRTVQQVLPHLTVVTQKFPIVHVRNGCHMLSLQEHVVRTTPIAQEVIKFVSGMAPEITEMHCDSLGDMKRYLNEGILILQRSNTRNSWRAFWPSVGTPRRSVLKIVPYIRYVCVSCSKVSLVVSANCATFSFLIVERRLLS